VSDERPGSEPDDGAGRDLSAEGGGADLVRAALAQARAAARARGLSPGQSAARTRRAGSARSGPRRDAHDPRDPMPFGEAIARLVEERGWQDTTAAASVIARWDALVGTEIAEHCRPASLVDGELVVAAESSAWATQLRLLTPTLLARLTAQVGAGVVRSIVVRGPAQPDWQRGPRRVRGRGPRDTYG
jgi:predicted nucleic acid-binding Zn ribbon protein